MSSSNEPPPPPPEDRLTLSDLDSSTAETQLFESIEGRRGRVRTASGEAYQAAVTGERPMLGHTVSFEQMYNLFDSKDDLKASSSLEGSDTSPVATKKPSPRFRDIAQLVIQKRREEKKKAASSKKKASHKRSGTLNAHALLQIITEEDPTAVAAENSEVAENTVENQDVAATTTTETSAEFFNAVGGHEKDLLGTSAFAVEDSHMDQLVYNALRVEKLLQRGDGDEERSSSSTSPTAEDQLPLLGEDASYGATQMERLRERRQTRRNRRKCLKLFHKILRCLSPYRWLCLFGQMLTSAYFVLLAMPLFVMAWIFYYYLKNPRFDFMPGKATLSWWFNFIGRQLLTLELARLTQYIIIDGLVLGSKHTVQWLGPLVTLWALQAKGWPLVAICWGVWDLLLLHGDNPFQTHWLYMTGIKIYSLANSGSYILSSDLYLRFLLSLILAGLAISVKRALVAIHFGRRTFVVFKPRLKKILQDIVILSEVADLAEEADRIASGETDVTGLKSGAPAKSKGVAGSVRWLRHDGFYNLDSSDQLRDETVSDSDSVNSPNPVERKGMLKHSASANLSRSESGSIRIKQFLDRWQEPVNKLEKTSDASIHDILRFRRALAFMDDPLPFGDAFGPASTRDECIESAHNVYQKLVRLTPGSSVLSNDVIAMLAQEEDETVNEKKRNALRKFIRPDRFGNIPLLAFVQTCDSLYRRLRYFRASVGNASVIDHALEKIIDGAYGFFLFLIILSVMNINPWPLLVSLSTLLVSFSFAMGASASKYIEGVLLIAVRRPYDLGDRIVLDSNGPYPGAGISWFVEDINLFSTTVRFALTNEVATVNNGTISGERIRNLNRSPNAVCVLEQPMHVRFIEKDGDEVFKAAIERYIVDHPRVWEALVNYRFNLFDADNEKIWLRLDVKHRNSWQDATRVLRDFGEFQRFVFNLGETMKVNFDSAPARRILYQGGVLKSGQIEDYKISLYANKNINNYSDEDVKPTPRLPVEKKVADSLFLAQLQRSNEPLEDSE